MDGVHCEDEADLVGNIIGAQGLDGCMQVVHEHCEHLRSHEMFLTGLHHDGRLVEEHIEADNHGVGFTVVEDDGFVVRPGGAGGVLGLDLLHLGEPIGGLHEGGIGDDDQLVKDGLDLSGNHCCGRRAWKWELGTGSCRLETVRW